MLSDCIIFRIIIQWQLLRKSAPQVQNLVPNNKGDKVTSSKSRAVSPLCSSQSHLSLLNVVFFRLDPSTLSSSISLVMFAACYFVYDLTTSYSHNIYPMLMIIYCKNRGLMFITHQEVRALSQIWFLMFEHKQMCLITNVTLSIKPK